MSCLLTLKHHPLPPSSHITDCSIESQEMEMVQSTKKPGDLSSAFSETSDIDWPSRFKDLKDEINPQNVEAAWGRLLESLDIETQNIQRRGPSVIPTIDFTEIVANSGNIPESRLEEIKHRGVLVIRHVVDEETALQYKKDVQNYISKNKEKILGFPSTSIKLNS